MQLKTFCLIPLIGFLVAACGGGGGGGNSNPSSASSIRSSSSMQSSLSSASSVSSMMSSSLISSSSSLSMSSSSLSVSSSVSSVSSQSSISSVSSSSSSSQSSTPAATDAVVISPPGAAGAKVTIDDQGNAWAIWRGAFPNTNGTNLIGNRYTKGQGWGAAQLLENDGADVDKFNLYTDAASGRTTVIWTQLTSAGAYDLWVRRYDPATGWANPERIESSDGAMGDFALPITDAQGKVITVWSQLLILGRFSVVSSVYTPGSGWSTPVEIEDNNVLGGQDGTPSLASLGNGKAVVVWLNSGNNRTNIATNRYDPASGWGTDEVLIADTGGNMTVNYPRVINDGTDKALLVWGQWDNLGSGSFTSRIMAKRYDAGWSNDNVIVGEDAGSDLVSSPRVAANTNGTAAVTWARKNQAVMVNTRGANGTWSQQTELKPGNADFLQSVPEIGLDSAADGLVVWSQESNDNSTKDSWFSTFSIQAGGWSAGQLLEKFVGTAVEPMVAVNAAGDRVVVWYNFNNFGSPGSEIYARYFPAGSQVTTPADTQ